VLRGGGWFVLNGGSVFCVVFVLVFWVDGRRIRPHLKQVAGVWLQAFGGVLLASPRYRGRRPGCVVVWFSWLCGFCWVLFVVFFFDVGFLFVSLIN